MLWRFCHGCVGGAETWRSSRSPRAPTRTRVYRLRLARNTARHDECIDKAYSLAIWKVHWGYTPYFLWLMYCQNVVPRRGEAPETFWRKHGPSCLVLVPRLWHYSPVNYIYIIPRTREHPFQIVVVPYKHTTLSTFNPPRILAVANVSSKPYTHTNHVTHLCCSLTL